MRRRHIQQIMKNDPFIPKVSLIAAILYGFIYYASAGYMGLSAILNNNLLFAADPLALLWQTRGPFIWEPIMQVNFLWFRIQFAIPNLLLALTLALLVYGNLTLVLIGIRHPRACRLDHKHQGRRLLSMVPALFTGFGCCAPTLIILWVSLFGSVSTLTITLFRWFLPFGLLLLALGMASGYRAVSKAS